MKRGSSGTNGAWNSAIRPRSTSMNGSLRLVRTPACSSVVSPPRPRRIEERILAEERVASDVLAAFHALEQERVVGVLGDLQKRRDRRQQVRHDLAPHRHERAAPRQLHELVERRLLHVLTDSRSEKFQRRARIDRVTGAGTPVHHSNCRQRLRHQHFEAADRLGARGARAAAAARVSRGL